MEYSPTPMFENERTGVERECMAVLAILALQGLPFIIWEDEEHDS